MPVLLLTGAFEPFDQERAAQVGSDGFLAKPFEPETLIAKVKDLLSRAGSGPRCRLAPTAGVPRRLRVGEMVRAASVARWSRARTCRRPASSRTSPSRPSRPGHFEEARLPLAAGDVPLAAVTAEESATLAGEAPPDEPERRCRRRR